MLGTVWAAGWARCLPTVDPFCFAMVLAMHTLVLAKAVAVTTLGRSEFAVFATTCFLDQVSLVLGALACFVFSRSFATVTLR